MEKHDGKKRLRFSLRSLLVLFILVAIPFSAVNRIQSYSARTQRFLDNSQQISLECALYFELEDEADEFALTGNWRWTEKYTPTTAGPEWAKKYLGKYAFDEIEGINVRKLEGESLSGCLDFSDVAGVKRIRIAGAPNLVSLKGIEHLSDLEMLVICDAPNLKSIKGIKGSHKLTRLILQNCNQLSDVNEIGSLTKLEALSLNGSRPTDLRFLRNLSKLKFLQFTLAQSTCDLSDLENMSALRWLEISNCPSLQAVTGLENLENLASLKIHHCPVWRDARGLENLKRLEALEIWNCPLATNFAAGTLQTPLLDLILVDLSSAQARSLSDLSGHPTLRKIWIGTPDNTGWVSGPRASISIPGFSDLPNLAELTIRSDSKDQFECFSEMPKLERVEILENAAETLPKFEAVPALNQVTLEKCSAITSLEGLNNIAGLEKLICKDCPKLRDVTALEGHANLNDLWFHRASLGQHKQKGQRLESLENLPSLVKLSINKVPLDDLDLRSLYKLKKLECLEINSNLGLTSAGGDRLKLQLPNCDVSFFIFDNYTYDDDF